MVVLRRLIILVIVFLGLGLAGCNQAPPEVNPEDRLDNPKWACGKWVSIDPESTDYIEITSTNIVWSIKGQSSLNLAEYLKSDYVKIKTRYRYITEYTFGYRFVDNEWFPKLGIIYISLIGSDKLRVVFNNSYYTYFFTLAE